MGVQNLQISNFHNGTSEFVAESQYFRQAIEHAMPQCTDPIQSINISRIRIYQSYVCSEN
jgi:hypothetical protein